MIYTKALIKKIKRDYFTKKEEPKKKGRPKKIEKVEDDTDVVALIIGV